MTVAIIDYGSGNLRSAQKAFERAAKETGIDVEIALCARAEELRSAERIVLPGVGAYADCKAGLRAIDGMWETLHEQVIDKGKPFFGICVGMQLMAGRGLENGETPGFGWIAGEVVKLSPPDRSFKIPHMGWNTLRQWNPHPLIDDGRTRLGEDGAHAYFVHSYQFATAQDRDVVASTDHGEPVTAIVARDNMFGTQFHPEKSQGFGLALIGNFLRWTP